MLQLTGRSDPSLAHALPRTNETLRAEAVRIICTRARHTKKCRFVRELTKFDATLIVRYLHHGLPNVKCQVRTTLMEDCQSGFPCMNVSASMVRVVVPLQPEPSLHP